MISTTQKVLENRVIESLQVVKIGDLKKGTYTVWDHIKLIKRYEYYDPINEISDSSE